MCTPKYLRTGTPITDLSYYSLKLNSNIPTTFTTTQYTPSNTGVSSSLDGNSLPKLASVPVQAPFPLHLPKLQNEYQKPTKLDLLIQTATSAEFEPLFPSDVNSLPGSPPSGRSSIDGSASVNAIGSRKRSYESEFGGVHSHSHSHSHSYKRSMRSPSLEISNLLSSNSESEDGSSSYSSSSSRRASVTSASSTSSIVGSNDAPTSNSTSTSSAAPVKIKRKSGKQQPKSIKLASPSNATKRQRSGPSCDCCRSRKIKCDSEITIISQLPNMYLNLTSEESGSDASVDVSSSKIAHCKFISRDGDYQYFKIVKDEVASASSSSALNSAAAAKLGSFDYLKFKPCSACNGKNLQCCFSKGFTRNDIIKFNKSEKLHRALSPPIGSNTNVNPHNQSPQQTQLQSQTQPHLTYPSVHSPISSPTATATNILAPSPVKPSIPVSSLQQPASIPSTNPLPIQISATSTSTSTTSTKTSRSHSHSHSHRQGSTSSSRQSKKTSCKSCRYKKIKCMKVDGSEVCLSCNKKNLTCEFE
ncbi:unnamed protein product [Ambrosiozyma monospora]|uniref:Unnamed protein product n=1 Tax=Ambrosiozyma monospora TaxID=43982 RepID=A0A9W6YQ03_AMBMO|nr:unnamed protein product [Ambrosiozyma monospora]